MRSKMLGAALLLFASSLAVGAYGCESGESGEGAYQEGGGNQRVNLPEDAQRQHDGRGVEMNVETGDEGEREGEPGRQQEPTPQAGGQGSGAAPSNGRDRSN